MGEIVYLGDRLRRRAGTHTVVSAIKYSDGRVGVKQLAVGSESACKEYAVSLVAMPDERIGTFEIGWFEKLQTEGLAEAKEIDGKS